MTTTDHDLEDGLGTRFAEAVSDLTRAERTNPVMSHSRDPARHQFTRSSQRLQVGAVLLAVLALGVVPAYAAGRASAPTTNATTATPTPTAATLPPPVVVQKAISWALSAARSAVLSVSRIEVKLVTYKDFYRVWGDFPGTCNQGYGATVNATEYVVAMSGDFLTLSSLPTPRPQDSTPPPRPPSKPTVVTTHWAALEIPTDPGGIPEAAPQFLIANVNMPGNWPPCFDMLTDVSR